MQSRKTKLDLVWRRKEQTDKVETQTSGKALAAFSLFMEMFSFGNLNVSINVLLKWTESDSEQNLLNVWVHKSVVHNLKQLSWTLLHQIFTLLSRKPWVFHSLGLKNRNVQN